LPKKTALRRLTPELPALLVTDTIAGPLTVAVISFPEATSHRIFFAIESSVELPHIVLDASGKFVSSIFSVSMLRFPRRGVLNVFVTRKLSSIVSSKLISLGRRFLRGSGLLYQNLTSKMIFLNDEHQM